MTDVFDEATRRRVMSRIRCKDTGPEKRIARLLDSLGLGYIYQFRIGRYRYDFYVPELNLLIEYRSCFWHYCPYCYGDRIPVKGGINGRRWWEEKLRGNRERDKRKEELARRMGYRLIIVWEHEGDPAEVLAGKLKDFIPNGTDIHH